MNELFGLVAIIVISYAILTTADRYLQYTKDEIYVVEKEAGPNSTEIIYVGHYADEAEQRADSAYVPPDELNGPTETYVNVWLDGEHTRRYMRKPENDE